MLIFVLLVLFYFIFPVFIIYLTRVSKACNKIGAVVLAYATGLILGNIGILPHPSNVLRVILQGKASLPISELLPYLEQGKITTTDVFANQVAGVQDVLTTIVIPLAIPLLLFSMDIRRWLKLAKGALLSLVLGLVSLLIVVFAGYFMLKDTIADSWKITGMLIGIYTGGTPNLAAISTALDVDPNIFILTHTYDMVIGAICLVFILTSAQRLFNLFLPHFNESHKDIDTNVLVAESEEMNDFAGMLTKKGIVHLLKAFGVSVFILICAGLLSLVVPESARLVTAILTITSLGLAFSMVKSINKIEYTFQLGMYFIIVFSLVVASMGNLSSMFSIDFLYLFLFVALAVLGSMIVHVFLSWVFKVDSDTTIVTIAALTYSPPFVPVVASALKNKEVIISGLTVGILGYAFGNYLGVAIAYFLRGF